MNIQEYLAEVTRIHKTGAATEHSYRSALQNLFSTISDDVQALNEPKRVKCGAPDFLINRGEIVIGHVEAKDIDKDLSTLKGTEADQKSRYLKALPNLIYTNCLDFEFYREGVLLTKISIADFDKGIQPKPENFQPLDNQLRDFAAQKPQTITSSEKLAEIMAGKAVLIKDVLFKALREDENLQTEISGQFKAFQEHLIHDITPEDFADIYAETIAYGMFAARLHDDTLDTFSRQEALELLPKSNPFLRSLFGYIAGHDLDERIKWIIDDLADVFQAANVKKLMENFGSLTGRNDPFLHFYETFLAKYNPAKRKARGVWYTPEPVVNFIVRAVDEVLQTEFGLTEGLADTSKVTIDWDTGQTDKKGKPVTNRKDVHRVQILDPATGTGTFLAEVIKQIAPRIKGVAEGMWSGYIEKDLIPRLHGFELLMASYAMCHMKLDMILGELGYKPSKSPPRLGVYLTNSLEEGEREVRDLFMAQWLTREAKEANIIKRQTPIMCVIGNPPYSGESANKSDWIMGLMEAYKREPGSKQRLQERNPKWINDDYVKFIRFAEHLIERTGEGVLGFITNHGYLDNPTFRGMRWHLLNTFDKIYVLDLHGNSKKKEATPDGSPDKNVFDIQQGVAIIIGVKKRAGKGAKPLAEVFHSDLWGNRAGKYEFLWKNGSRGKFWKKLEHRAPQYPLIQRDYDAEGAYKTGFGVHNFMPLHGNGIVTKRDRLNIHEKRVEIIQMANDFLNMEENEVRKKYHLPKDVRDWRYEWAKKDIEDHKDKVPVEEIGYRLFDSRFIFYSGRARGVVGWPVGQIMYNYLRGENIGLLTSKAHRDRDFAHIFVTDKPTEAIHFSATTGSNAMNFPLYIYPDEQSLDQNRRINFDQKLWKNLQKLAKHPEHGIPDEIATFDYIYGVLHCPLYRDTYAEFLKIDFPRIPWPSSPDEFWDISEKGSQLRRLHLMEAAAVGNTPFPLKGEGAAQVDKPRFENGSVWINDTQFFDGVPVIAWEFFIGGYQPAQKWLKDRKGRELSFDDVKHYQKIIKILAETDRVMKTITMKF